jgi:hypothetical protein
VEPFHRNATTPGIAPRHLFERQGGRIAGQQTFNSTHGEVGDLTVSSSSYLGGGQLYDRQIPRAYVAN